MARKKEPVLIVIDPQTRQTGILERTAGYVSGGSYVNPGWRIVWDNDIDDPGEGE